MKKKNVMIATGVIGFSLNALGQNFTDVVLVRKDDLKSIATSKKIPNFETYLKENGILTGHQVDSYLIVDKSKLDISSSIAQAEGDDFTVEIMQAILASRASFNKVPFETATNGSQDARAARKVDGK